MKVTMSKIPVWMIWLVLFGFGATSFFSCAEKSSQEATSTPADDDDDDSTTGGDTSDDDDDDDSSGLDVCEELEGSSKLGDFDDLIKLLCGSGDHSLDSQSAYTGGTAKDNDFTIDEEDKDGVIEYTLSSLMNAPLSAKDYFDLLLLKFGNPDKFAKSYDTGEGITYEEDKVVDEIGKDIDYHYTNKYYETDDPASLIEYEATTKTFELKKDALYVVGTKLTKAIDTIDDLIGLIVVVKDGSKTSKVYSASIQGMKYNGDDEKKVSSSRVKESVRKEMTLSYENAEKAGE
jgi:hypothetical protein